MFAMERPSEPDTLLADKESEADDEEAEHDGENRRYRLREARERQKRDEKTENDYGAALRHAGIVACPVTKKRRYFCHANKERFDFRFSVLRTRDGALRYGARALFAATPRPK
jgi:hypothetical protein